MSRWLDVEQFKHIDVVDQMMQLGAASVPLIPDARLLQLINEVKGIDFDPRIKVDSYSGDNLVFRRFGNALAKFVNGPLNDALSFKFGRELSRSSYVLNRYSANSSMSRHWDGRNGVICVTRLLDDQRGFYVAPGPVGIPFEGYKISSKPGEVIFMRAPGFNGTDNLVYHWVTASPNLGYSLVFSDPQGFRI